MGIFFTPFFWGLLLIVWGATVVISVLFRIDIPVGRIMVAFVLIYFGLRMLVGWGGFDKLNNKSFFRDEQVKITIPSPEYNVIFGRRDFDMTGVSFGKENPPIKMNMIFGAGNLIINQSLPVRIHVNSCFAETVTPDGNHINFGNYTYLSPHYKEGQPNIQVETNVIFGRLEIIQEK